MSLVLMELELAVVHKTQKKKRRKIGQYPVILTLNWLNESLYIYLRLDLNKHTGLEKHFQMTVFLSENEKTQKRQQ